MERTLSKRKIDSTEKSRELKKSRSRPSELDGLFQRLYEDRASGVISERNYRLLAEKYEVEQRELEQRIGDAEQTLKDSQ
jgi:site-specific DNA recombinase